MSDQIHKHGYDEFPAKRNIKTIFIKRDINPLMCEISYM